MVFQLKTVTEQIKILVIQDARRIQQELRTRENCSLFLLHSFTLSTVSLPRGVHKVSRILSLWSICAAILCFDGGVFSLLNRKNTELK